MSALALEFPGHASPYLARFSEGVVALGMAKYDQ